MTTQPVSPSDADLKSALISLKITHPTLGIPKIHAQLLASHPDWAVSEKRARKVLKTEGLTISANATTTQPDSLVPLSRFMPDSAFTLPPSVSVRDFGRRRGKGLIATTAVMAGETLWIEDPWILAPEWDFYDLQQQGGACSHCSTPLKRPPVLCEDCGLHFCNRLCLNRARDTGHRILCTQSGRRLLALARKMSWMGLHALAKATARVLQTHENDVFEAFAVLGMEQKFQFQKEEVGQLREIWNDAFSAYKAAFTGRKLGELGTMDGFLKGLGRMSLNLESHGGLYILHSHMNHSCEPNVSVRHLHQREALARITVLTRREILPGEELTITYVDPEMSYLERRRALGEWGFVCNCARCEKEAKEVDTSVNNLALELKEGFGVF